MDRAQYSHQLAHQELQERIKINERKQSEKHLRGSVSLFKDLYELNKMHELGIAPKIPPLHPEDRFSTPHYKLINERWMDLTKYFI